MMSLPIGMAQERRNRRKRNAKKAGLVGLAALILGAAGYFTIKDQIALHQEGRVALHNFAAQKACVIYPASEALAKGADTTAYQMASKALYLMATKRVNSAYGSTDSTWDWVSDTLTNIKLKAYALIRNRGADPKQYWECPGD